MIQSQSISINGEIFEKESLHKLFFPNEQSDSWKNTIYNFLMNWFDDSKFIITQTSGSTGKPKEIKLLKQSMINSASMTNEFFGLDNTKTALLCLPASYIAGKMMIVRALIGGFNLISVEPTANPFENLYATIDFTAVTPYQLFNSYNTIKHKHIKNIIVGGGQVSSKLETFVKSLSTNFYETYGMTETASHIALRCFKGGKKSDYFKVLNGISIQQDDRNCLVINAPHLLADKIITNDIVEIKDKDSFRWLGRYDSMINSGGIKIHPEQVEQKLENIIPFNYYISSEPDDQLDNKVILVIESENLSTERMTKLNQEIQSVLKKYEIPKTIYCIPEFIYSTSNKILKKDTLKRIKDL